MNKISTVSFFYSPLRFFQISSMFSDKKQRGRQPSLQEDFGFVKQKKKLSQTSKSVYAKTLPEQKFTMFMNQHLVQVSLYMRHNCWQSQYIFNMFNYQKIGFKKISDFTYLKQASYALGLRHLKPDQQWPTMKFVKPVTQPFIITGVDNIYKFLDEHGLIKQSIDMNVNETLNSHIQQKIIPSLQYVFLHPRLTMEEHYHFDSTAENYTIIGTTARNLKKMATNTIKNLIKIYKNKQEYEKSRDAFKSSMKELEHFFRNDQQFIGGPNICYMDLYLYSIICTKMQSQHFAKYLQQELGGKVWNWIRRMKRITNYDPERITVV